MPVSMPGRCRGNISVVASMSFKTSGVISLEQGETRLNASRWPTATMSSMLSMTLVSPESSRPTTRSSAALWLGRSVSTTFLVPKYL